jgi:hypothetical protein
MILRPLKGMLASLRITMEGPSGICLGFATGYLQKASRIMFFQAHGAALTLSGTENLTISRSM